MREKGDNTIMKRLISYVLCTVMIVCTVLGVNIPVMAEEIDENSINEQTTEPMTEVVDEPKYEGNDTFGEATWIGTNEVVTDNLESGSDKNYYKFSIDSDGYVSFNFNHQYVDGNNVRWVLEFYDLNQELMFKEYFYGNVDESITITTQNAGIPVGTYYICVRPYGVYSSQYSTAIYNLRVNYTSDSSWETEFNDKISQADYISTNCFYNGSVMTASDNDYYCFKLNEDGYIRILFNHDYVDGNYEKWVVSLYDIDEKEMIRYYYKGNVPESTIEETCNVGLSKGKYYIRIRPYGSYNGSYYSFVNYCFGVSYNPTENCETEWNDLISTADYLSSAQTITGNQMTGSDKDYYYFESTKDGIVAIRFSHDYEDGKNTKWVVTLYDEKENQISQNMYAGNDTEISVDTNWMSAGKYYIKVAPYSSNYSCVPYYLSVNYNDGSEGNAQTMYRLFNPYSGEHIYTADEVECYHLANTGWNFEGRAWLAPSVSNTPVYRLCNPNNGDHHYTTDIGERDILAVSGWTYEGIGWYSDDLGGTPLNRLFNPNTLSAGAHHYTIDDNEVQVMVSNGWQYEGVGWYGL